MTQPRLALVRRLRMAFANRKGFALPLTILVIAALTATLAAAFSSVAAEIATNSAQRSESRAFALAQSGLEEFLARRQYHCTPRAGYAPNCSAPPMADIESVTVSLAGGYANVVAERVRRAIGITQPAMYLIRSLGVDTVAPFNGATRTVYGERIVAQYATWNAQNIQVLSGWTSLTGLNKNGTSGKMWGRDHCSLASGGGAPTVAGVLVPNVPGYTGAPNWTSGSGAGAPPIDSLGTQAQANAQVKIDWNAIVNGGQVSADYTFPNSQNAPAGLVTAWANPNIYPVVHVTGAGSWTIPGGRGLMIIDGNAVMSGNTKWEGIIMVGGTFTSNGTTDIFGAVVSGLNMKLTPLQLTQLLGSPTYPGQSDVGNGTKDIEYDSCEVMKAASRFGYFRTIPNAWMDNFTTY